VEGAVGEIGISIYQSGGRPQIRKIRVQFYLVDGRNDLGGLEKGLEVSDTKVGDTDGSGLASIDELLHLLPGVGELPVLVDNCLVLRVDGVWSEG
jgi:hypothetical protein